MKDIKTLNEIVYSDFITAVKKDNEVIINSFLNVIDTQGVKHEFVQDFLISLLKHDSQFISKRAFQILDEMENKPKKVKKALKKLEKK